MANDSDHGRDQRGAHRRRYQAPQAIDLGALAKVAGQRADCSNGSGNTGVCTSGYGPTGNCVGGGGRL